VVRIVRAALRARRRLRACSRFRRPWYRQPKDCPVMIQPTSCDDPGELQVEARPLVGGLGEEVVVLHLPRVAPGLGAAPD
jgi:hypothetical protein